jgi:hypothetical protein
LIDIGLTFHHTTVGHGKKFKAKFYVILKAFPYYRIAVRLKITNVFYLRATKKLDLIVALTQSDMRPSQQQLTPQHVNGDSVQPHSYLIKEHWIFLFNFSLEARNCRHQ